MFFDVSGKLVANLYDGFLAADQHQITWDQLANIPTGMYFANLQTEEGKMFIRVVVNE